MSSTRLPSRRSAASPSRSFATPSRSTQIQNHSAEPREYQEQALRGDPARPGVREELGDGEDQIRNREQRGPRVGVAAPAYQAAQRREQQEHGERAHRPG